MPGAISLSSAASESTAQVHSRRSVPGQRAEPGRQCSNSEVCNGDKSLLICSDRVYIALLYDGVSSEYDAEVPQVEYYVDKSHV